MEIDKEIEIGFKTPVKKMEKEFNLKDKRKELFEEVFDKEIEKELFIIFNCIEDQDKEFIKRLKEELPYNKKSWSGKVHNIIDKLSGELK